MAKIYCGGEVTMRKPFDASSLDYAMTDAHCYQVHFIGAARTERSSQRLMKDGTTQGTAFRVIAKPCIAIRKWGYGFPEVMPIYPIVKNLSFVHTVVHHCRLREPRCDSCLLRTGEC